MDTWMIVLIVVAVLLVVVAVALLMSKRSHHKQLEADRRHANEVRERAQARQQEAHRIESEAEEHAARARTEAALAEQQALEARKAKAEAAEHHRQADQLDPDVELGPDGQPIRNQMDGQMYGQMDGRDDGWGTDGPDRAEAEAAARRQQLNHGMPEDQRGVDIDLTEEERRQAEQRAAQAQAERQGYQQDPNAPAGRGRRF